MKETNKKDILTPVQHAAMVCIIVIAALPGILGNTALSKFLPTHPLGLLHASISVWFQ